MSDARVLQWARAQQSQFLLRDFFTYAKYAGGCPSIEEDPYREACEYLEGLLPDTPHIREWRLRTGRIAVPPARHEQQFGILLMPRLTFKSSLIQALVTFAIAIDPDITIVIGRATQKMAERSLRGIQSVLESPPIVSAFGNQRALFSTWASGEINRIRAGTGRDPTVSITSLETPTTGAHPALVIMDDLVHETNYQSGALMELARMRTQSYFPMLERWGTLLLVGTRWGDNDLYGWALDENQKLVDREKSPLWKAYVRGAYGDDGQLFVPYVLSEAHLNRLRDTTDTKLFAAWYLNEARASGEDIFPSAYLQYVDEDHYTPGRFPELYLADTVDNARVVAAHGTRIPLSTVMLVDPAPTVGKYSDFTGVVVVGFDPIENWWVLGAWELKLLPTERLNWLVLRAMEYRPALIALENADLVAPLLEDALRERGLATKVVAFDPRKDRQRITASELAPKGRTKKSAQIEALEPVYRARRMYFLRGRAQPLVRQLAKYPYLDHDDVLDAFSMARAYSQQLRLSVAAEQRDVYEDIEAREYALEGLDIATGGTLKREDQMALLKGMGLLPLPRAD